MDFLPFTKYFWTGLPLAGRPSRLLRSLRDGPAASAGPTVKSKRSQ
jgi:hypothetical protein